MARCRYLTGLRSYSGRTVVHLQSVSRRRSADENLPIHRKEVVDKWGLALNAGVLKIAEKYNSFSACTLLSTGQRRVRRKGGQAP